MESCYTGARPGVFVCYRSTPQNGYKTKHWNSFQPFPLQLFSATLCILICPRAVQCSHKTFATPCRTSRDYRLELSSLHTETPSRSDPPGPHHDYHTMAPCKRKRNDSYHDALGILGERTVNGQLQYKVAWAGRDSNNQQWEPSWEPCGHITSQLRNDWEVALAWVASEVLYTGLSDAYLLLMQGHRSANHHEVILQKEQEQARAQADHEAAEAKWMEEKRRAAEEKMAAEEKRVAEEKKKRAAEDNEERCFVCLEAVDDGMVVILTPCCGQDLCVTCEKRWFKETPQPMPKCPYCRQSYTR
ncbi:hypothetical protein FB567DRAFT_215037 [Paraphoma chrysanthemicola]|uniref:RING-type domain-containing protein n=1 Tax=Paraphoma chrysanthemicola TaxID=798071 RepID=A0A8K0VSI8_9PLEO|nr:hypothetical protein FB567DRAFT_215037 [Paraphoma chrysanthemicola]